MTRYTAALEDARGWIARHQMAERPSRSFWFSEPGKGSIYAYSLTWAPGTLSLAGDLGELTLTHYHAMPTLSEAVAWAGRADADYLLGKSGRKKVIDREATIGGIIEGAIESVRIRERLQDHFVIGRAWGAGLKALLQREVPRALQDLGDDELPRFIYDLHHFDDWYGSYSWAPRELHQIAAIQAGCQMIAARLGPEAMAA